MYPGADYSQLAQKLGGATGQYTQGIDPDWTSLAAMYGFRQNPYPAVGTEGQDQMRFLATLKSIADAQLGGPQGPYSQASPNNPIAAMPFGMSQYMSAMAPLFQSIQGKALMPLDQVNQFANGYQYGPLNTGTESALMKMLREQRGGGAAGQTPFAGTTPGQAGQVSGGNTPGQTPPPSAQGPVEGPPAPTDVNPAPVAAPDSTAQQDIIAGLQSNSGGLTPNVSTPGVSTDRKEARPSGFTEPVPAPLAQVWQDYLKYRQGLSDTAKSQESNAWTGDIAKGFANWLGERFGRPAKA